MSRLANLLSLTGDANAALAGQHPSERPVLNVPGESADLRVVSFEPLNTQAYSQYVHNTPWLQGDFTLHALQGREIGRAGSGVVRISGILGVEPSRLTRSGYVGLDLEAGTVNKLLGIILGEEQPHLVRGV